MKAACLRHSRVPSASRLFLDFLYHFERVRDFYRYPPELARAAELCAVLLDRLGLSADDILTHRELAATSSPGRYFPEAEFRERVRSAVLARRTR